MRALPAALLSRRAGQPVRNSSARMRRRCCLASRRTVWKARLATLSLAKLRRAAARAWESRAAAPAQEPLVSEKLA